MGSVKAWSCIEDSEGTGGIVFAKKRQQAEIIASCRYGSGEGIGEYEARRAPWADRFASAGTIPISVMVECGWRFECSGCDETITDYGLKDRGLPIDGLLGEQDALCFCSQACKDRYDARQAQIAIARAEGLDAMRAEFRRRLPRAALHEVRSHGYAHCWNGRAMFEEGSIYFDFPGQNIGPASLEMRRNFRCLGPTRPEFMCCAGDREAFEAWLQKVKRPIAEAAE